MVIEAVVKRFRERLCARISNNETTFAKHPDVAVSKRAAVRLQAYRLALRELDDMMKEAGIDAP